MNFSIMNRRKAIDFTYDKCDEFKYIIISIFGRGEDKAKFYNNPSLMGVLYCHFEDTEDSDGISHKDAKDIIKFVQHCQDKINLIVVHCQAGISRSAGVCAALSRYLDGDDDWVFRNPKYKPNMRCYKYILDERNINYDNWKEKIDMNNQAFLTSDMSGSEIHF